jgi:hypothetical protein
MLACFECAETVLSCESAGPRKSDRVLRCIPPDNGGIRDDDATAIFERVQGGVSLEALRGDKTIQEIAAKHQVHPNQASTWKRQAIDGLSEVFSNGADRELRDRESEVRDLHAASGAPGLPVFAPG